MKSRISARARELGFDLCRVTSAAPPETEAAFSAWLDQRRYGNMAYLPRSATRRRDPQRVLPGVQSIVCVAVNYALCGPNNSAIGLSATIVQEHTDEPIPSPVGRGQPRGLVARYAQFEDYHEVLGRQLDSLVEFIHQLGGADTRSAACVDTGPVLERDYAQRAGIGFVGKHTNLISRRFGNWLLLGEILTTLPLEADPPEKNRCGSCTRCLKACPTQAIVAPFELDARRCLSYLTIEFKGSIPLEFRLPLGSRIFGCDICLEVCPWNRFAQDSRLMKQHARFDLDRPDLLALLALDEAGFQSRFAGTPLLRPGRRGLLRNVCVALGNTGHGRALSALDRAANEPEPLIAEHARWAIERIQARGM